jgi:hypothetical protein
MNINANLNYNGFSAFGLLGTTYTAQPSLATLTTLYVIGNELYYNDGAGNVVQITSGGTVNATSSGISSGTASASFSSGVLVVNSASSTPASIKMGSALLGATTAASPYLTLSPPASLSSGAYTLTLPAVAPASGTYYLKIDTSGNISPIAQPAANVVISSSSGSFTTTSLSYVPVTNLSVSITTSGGPVNIRLQDDGLYGGSVGVNGGGGVNSASGVLSFFRNSSQISIMSLRAEAATVTSTGLNLPPGSFSFTDSPGAGTYTYSVQVEVVNGVSNMGVINCTLVAQELR